MTIEEEDGPATEVHDEEVVAKIRERWRALPEEGPRLASSRAQIRTGPTPQGAASRSPTGARSKTASSRSVAARRADGASTELPGEGAEQVLSVTFPLVPLLIWGVVVTLDTVLLLLVPGGLILGIFERIGAGVLIAIALVPFRRWPGADPARLIALVVGSALMVTGAPLGLEALAEDFEGFSALDLGLWIIELGVLTGVALVALRQIKDDVLDYA